MARPAPEASRSATRGHRRVIVLLGVLGATAVIAGGWIWWASRSDESPGTTEPLATPSVTLSPARADQIDQQMTSGDEAQLRQAVALPSSAPLDPTLLPGLAGLDLDIDVSSYTPTGVDTATVEAAVTDGGGVATTWTLNLVLIDGVGWQVLDTVPDGGN